VHEHLRGDAPDVQARAAEGALLDDRDVPTGEPLVRDGVAGTGADDDQVEVPHVVLQPTT
jgi:hypothetical protein